MICCLPSASGLVPQNLAELAPGLLDLVDVGHVGHRAAGGEVRQRHGLLRRGEDVGGLGHEMHAAEHDVVGVRALRGVLGQLERVAHVIGVADDLVTLVEMPQNQ